MKKTVVIGASPKEARYSNLAVRRLKNHGHEVVAVGLREGEIDGIPVHKDKPPVGDVDTVTLYLNADHQKLYYDYILSLHPRRIIFNPGAENDELASMAESKGIKTMEACTLVMLATGQY